MSPAWPLPRLRLSFTVLVPHSQALHLPTIQPRLTLKHQPVCIEPGEAATSFLKRHGAGGDWRAAGWAISPEDLDRLEVALASALPKSGIRLPSFKARDFYRQYIPARWKNLHVIIVNGFFASESELFPNQGIAPDRW